MMDQDRDWSKYEFPLGGFFLGGMLGYVWTVFPLPDDYLVWTLAGAVGVGGLGFAAGKLPKSRPARTALAMGMTFLVLAIVMGAIVLWRDIANIDFRSLGR